MRVNSQLASQTTLYALIGATAGLMVWITMIWPTYSMWHPEVLEVSEIPSLRMATFLLLYLPLGILLGGAVALIEPIQDTSFTDAFKNEWRWTLRGVLLGAVGAFIGGWLGDFLLLKIIQGAADPAAIQSWARVFGVLTFGLVFGATLGLIDKWRTGSNDRFLAGLIGGAVGGILAALIFEFLVDSVDVKTVLALMVFAALILGSIGSISFLQTKATLVGMPGNIFKYSAESNWSKPLLSDTATFFGSALPTRISGKTNFKIAQDRDVMKEHAMLELDDRTKRWLLSRYDPSATELFVNKQRVKDQSIALRDGDVITIGRTSFRIRMER